MTAILGISAFYHDSAAALVVDGRIVAAAQEERFTRIKHDPAFPTHAIDYCLREAGTVARPISTTSRFTTSRSPSSSACWRPTWPTLPAGSAAFGWPCRLWLKDKLHMRRTLRRGSGGPTRRRLIFTDHHESHAASAFFPSPFDQAAIVTLDGVGEWSTATFGRRRGQPYPPDRPHLVSPLAGPAVFGVHLLLRLQGQQR